MKTYYGMTIDDAYEIVSKMVDASYTNQDYDDAIKAIHDFIKEHKGKTEEGDAQAKLYHDWLTEVDDE